MPHFISMGSHFLLRPEKESRSHLDQIATTLGQMSTHEDYADVTLHFPGKIKIKTNKIVLSQSSKMLDQIFNTSCVCANGYQPVTYDLLCPDLNPEAMQKILEILYQGKANLESEFFFQEMLHILECLRINLPLQSMKSNGNNNKEVFDKFVFLDSNVVKMEPSNGPYLDLNCKYCDKHFSTTADCEKHYFEHIVAEDKTQSNQIETYLANHVEAEVNSSISSPAYELSNSIFMGSESVSIQGQNLELGPVSYESQDFEPVQEMNSRSDLSKAQVHQPSNSLNTRVTWAKTSLALATMSKPYICLTCNKQYKGEKSLLNHQAKHQIPLKASIDLNASEESQTISSDFSFGNSDIETPTILLKRQSNKSQSSPGELNSNFLKNINSILDKSNSDTNNEEHVKASNFPITLNILKSKLPITNNKPTCKVSLLKLAHVSNPDSVSNLKDYPEEQCLSNEDNSQSNVLSNVPAVMVLKKKRGRPCKPILLNPPAVATKDKFKIKQNYESPKKSRNHLKRGIKSKQIKLPRAGSKHRSKLACILCHKLSATFGNLLIHLSNVHYKDSIKKIFGEDKYKCGLCSKVILHESSMLYHLATKHNSLKLCMAKEDWLKVKELQSRKSTATGENKPSVEDKKNSQGAPNQVSNKNIYQTEDASQMDDGLQLQNLSENDPSSVLVQNQEAKETRALKRKPKGIYKCHLCSHVSEHHNLFLSHMAITHYQKELSPLITKTDGECTQCQKVYSNKFILLKHLATRHNAIAHLIKDGSERSEEPKSVTKQIKQHQSANNSLSNISCNVSFEDSIMPLKTLLPKRKLLISQSLEKENNNKNSLTSLDQQVELETELNCKCNLCHQLFPNYDLLLRHYSHTHFKQDLKKFYGKVEGECRLCSNIMLNEDCLLQHLAITHNTLDKLIPEKHLLMANIKSEIGIHSKVLETTPLKLKEAPKMQPTNKRPALQTTTNCVPEQTLTKRSYSKPVLTHFEDTKIEKSVSQDIKTECALTKQEQKVTKLSKQKVTKLLKQKVPKVLKLKVNKLKKLKPKKEDQIFDKEAVPKAVQYEICENKNLKSNDDIKKSKKGSEDMTVYYCHMCPFQTGIYKKLPRHIGKVHLQDKVKEYYGSDKFSCSLCSETYTSEDFLINHIVAVHGVLSSIIPTQKEAASRQTKK